MKNVALPISVKRTCKGELVSVLVTGPKKTEAKNAHFAAWDERLA